MGPRRQRAWRRPELLVRGRAAPSRRGRGGWPAGAVRLPDPASPRAERPIRRITRARARPPRARLPAGRARRERQQLLAERAARLVGLPGRGRVRAGGRPRASPEREDAPAAALLRPHAVRPRTARTALGARGIAARSKCPNSQQSMRPPSAPDPAAWLRASLRTREENHPPRGCRREGRGGALAPAQ
eukprot:scaffold110224_cov33-Phaeocystis_antarctica.AAC.1